MPCTWKMKYWSAPRLPSHSSSPRGLFQSFPGPGAAAGRVWRSEKPISLPGALSLSLALSQPSPEISLTLSRRLSIKMGQGNLGEVWEIKPISDGPILGCQKKTYFPECPQSVPPN